MRSLKKTLVTVGAAATLLVAGATAASAETHWGDGQTYEEVSQGTGSNTSDNPSSTSCTAYAYRTLDNLNNAYGDFVNNNSGFNCLFYLQYEPTGTNNWVGYGSYASSPYVLYASSGYSSHTTGIYSFPLGTYEVRSCFKLQSTDGSWTGALHCTYGF